MSPCSCSRLLWTFGESINTLSLLALNFQLFRYFQPKLILLHSLSPSTQIHFLSSLSCTQCSSINWSSTAFAWSLLLVLHLFNYGSCLPPRFFCYYFLSKFSPAGNDSCVITQSTSSLSLHSYRVLFCISTDL